VSVWHTPSPSRHRNGLTIGRVFARLVWHGRRASAGQQGFTLLEIIVALAILSLSVVSLIQLSSQSLRLVKTSDDYQQAAQLADRLLADSQPQEEGVDTGDEGRFQWERRTQLVPLPEELQPAQTVPGQDGPKLFVVTIAVRWGPNQNQALEMATLYTPTTSPVIPSSASVSGQIPGGTPTTGVRQQQGIPSTTSQSKTPSLGIPSR
jgi:general secretion pathway protein I